MFRADEAQSRPLLGRQRDGALVEKAAASRSWMLINAYGQEMILAVDKYEIMDRLQIHPRDLYILDHLLTYPSVLTRGRVIILNLEHIKAVITAEEVLIRDPLDDNVLPVIEELQRRLKPLNDTREGKRECRSSFTQHDAEVNRGDASPFEFRALEVVLEMICNYFASRTKEFETELYPSLDMVTSKISCRHLDHFRKLKSRITRLAARSQKVRDGLQQLLDDDNDMADLYLSRKLSSSPLTTSGSIVTIAKLFLVPPSISSRQSRASKESTVIVPGDQNDILEVEALLEDYFKRIDDTFNKLTTLRDYIYTTEHYLNIRLDHQRNQFIKIELVLSAAAVCIGVHSCASGIFGVNIPYTWEYHYAYSLQWIASVPGIFSSILFALIMYNAWKKGLLGS